MSAVLRRPGRLRRVLGDPGAAFGLG